MNEISTDEAIDLLCSLTPAQVKAVEVLTDGGTHAEAAQAAGVARGTVTRWVSHSPAFRAALSRYRFALAQAHLDQASRVRAQALEIVGAHLDGLDPATPEALSAAVAALRALPAAAPIEVPLPAQVLAQIDLSTIRKRVAPDETTKMLALMDDPLNSAEATLLEAAGISGQDR